MGRRAHKMLHVIWCRGRVAALGQAIRHSPAPTRFVNQIPPSLLARGRDVYLLYGFFYLLSGFLGCFF